MKTTLAAAALGTAFLLCARTAAAAPGDLCVPQAFGVPGPQPKTPEWWNAAAMGKDERWTGSNRAAGAPTVTAASPMASVRTIWDRPSRTMFVRYEVNADQTLTPGFDRVIMALTDTAGARALAIVLDPMRGCVGTGITDADGNGVDDACDAGRAIPTGTGGGVQYATPHPTNADQWNALSPTNPLADMTVEHAWISVADDPMPGGGTIRSWTVQFAVHLPVDGSGEAGPGARTYASAIALLGSPSGGTLVEFASLCNPMGASADSCLLASPVAAQLPNGLPQVARWKPTRTSQQCNGVSLDPMFVGSSTPLSAGTTPDGQPYDYPSHEIRRTSGSQLRAGIRNQLGRALASGEVKATFRIANWGMTYANWDQATWDEIGEATLSGTVADGRWAHGPGQGTLQMATPYTPGGTIGYAHQCVHVQLEDNASGGTALAFANDSVYRNMDLVWASTFQRFAEINLVGRTPVDQPQRVTLVVDTRNMPSSSQCWVMPKDDDVPGYQDIPGCHVDGAKTPPPLLTSERNQWGTTIEGLPTYLVHGFVDSGKTIELEGQSMKIHMPFSAFGYAVQHQGQVNGWEHALHGAVHEPAAAPNVYVLDMKPSEIHTISTTIRAIDSTTPKCPDASAPKPWPEGCEPPTIPPPRAATTGEEPKPGPTRGCCSASVSTSKGQTVAENLTFVGLLLALRGARRRRRGSNYEDLR